MAKPPAERSAIASYFTDRQVPLWSKLVGLAALAYVVWPLDFIPDVPIIGWLDDLGVVALVAGFYVQRIREHRKMVEAGSPT